MVLEKKAKIIGAIVSAVAAILLLIFLVLYCLDKIQEEPEEGLAVAMGAEDAGGNDLFEPTPESEIADAVQPTPTPAPEPTPAPTPAPAAPELPTQNVEETVHLNTSKKKEKEKTKVVDPEEEKRKAEEKRQQLLAKQEAARKAAEEKRLKEEQDRKAAEIAAKFAKKSGKGTSQTSTGTGGGTNGGVKGSPNGGTGGSTGNAKTGNGNRWSLDGRSLKGSLVKPSYSDSEEGTIVVNITVDRTGTVVAATIGRGTNISTQSLRDAAIAAAKRTKFNTIEKGPDRQSGTIYYNFKLE